MPAREADPLAVDVGAGLAEEAQRVGVAAELDADLLEDRVGVVLDEREALLAEDLERRQRAGQERARARRAARAGRAWRAARPPVRRRGSSSITRSSVACRRATARGDVVVRRAAAVASPAGPLGASPGSVDDGRPGSGTAAVRCGKAIASTKCSWKRGSTAVSIFSTRRTTPSISRRAAPRQQRDQRAGAGGVAGRADVGEVAVGDEPEDHRVERVDLAAERAGEADLVDRVDRRAWSISRRTPA